jgi:DNA repair protein RadA/Sms
MVGHVTKDGDVAGPKTLEHAVDVMVSFEGEQRSGLRVLSAGKNRFGPEGEVAWFEMGTSGLAEVDPADHLRSGRQEAGAAIALPMAGRRAIAVEVQALSVKTEGPPRRQVAGLDPRRFGLIAAVLQEAGFPVGKAELYGAAGGGLHVDDPGADLAVAAALASAAGKVPAPPSTAFVGEVSLTGAIRAAGGGAARLAAAKAAGLRQVIGSIGRADVEGGSLRIRSAGHISEALSWAQGAARATGGR